MDKKKLEQNIDKVNGKQQGLEVINEIANSNASDEEKKQLLNSLQKKVSKLQLVQESQDNKELLALVAKADAALKNKGEKK
ncbi:hypothetical protein A8L34_11940 [Bacillus sp. FJAT-27264]|uniref:hypothetical protein n=1 Tax=Paenibacillus sp. (strain DSM 101736 / FJAT-27264) TaxID=1850362 RepID=UPI000807CB6F|nr:hypothetical protein [Bacillus sp. FJAT-27264]OBZ14626.1 hypothetical protein A8L34_11940 [Bacillus sp. FJAT-27264]